MDNIKAFRIIITKMPLYGQQQCSLIALFLFLFVILFPAFSFGQKISKREMKWRLEATDTNDVYSRNPQRPFRYGYPYDKAECLYHFNQISEVYSLHEGDVIADVGAASGWVDGALSVICDSITFYVEDIDTDYLNEDQFNRVITHFNQVRGGPQTNVLRYVIGTKTSTRLPDATFDKIIIDNAFHEIRKPEKILADVRKKLKPEGILIISDEFSSRYTIRRALGCDTKVKTVDWLSKLAAKKGLFLYDRKAPPYAYDNVLFFSKSKGKENEFLIDISGVYDDQIEGLETLAKIDTNYICDLFNLLSPEVNKMKAVYPLLDEYLSELTDACLDYKQNINAYYISLEALNMYPDDETICAAHAAACEQNGYLERSLEYYEKAAKLNITQGDYDDDIKRLKESMKAK